MRDALPSLLNDGHGHRFGQELLLGSVQVIMSGSGSALSPRWWRWRDGRYRGYRGSAGGLANVPRHSSPLGQLLRTCPQPLGQLLRTCPQRPQRPTMINV